MVKGIGAKQKERVSFYWGAGQPVEIEQIAQDVEDPLRLMIRNLKAKQSVW